MDDVITSFANPTIKWVKSLAQRKYRRREGAFVVEGLQPVWRAATSTWQIDTLIVAPELLHHSGAWETVSEQHAAGVRVVHVSGEVFRHLSDRDGPAGLLAVVRGVIGELWEFEPEAGRPVVALCEAGNPGNIGAIIRTADAAGVGGLVFVGACADPLAPAAVKSSMGSLFSLPVATSESFAELRQWAQCLQRELIAITGDGASDMWETSLPADPVLVMGSEGDGLPSEITGQCDLAVSITMEGTAESLNLATASAIVLYELSRRRHAKTPKP